MKMHGNRATIYCRYSSARQNEQSIDGQLRDVREYAQRMGYDLVGEPYIDREISGTVEDRPEFQRMIDDSKRGLFDIVIVYKLDRFSRSIEHSIVYAERLKKNGVKLVSATESIADTPEGKIMRSIYSAMAEMFIDDLRQKVIRGNRENRIKGLWTGGNALLGYKVIEKKVFVDEEKAEIVRMIFREYAGGKSKKQIVDMLNEKGILNYSGKPFKTSSLQDNMSNKKYLGIVEKDGTVYTNIFPQIIDNDLFDRVQKRLKQVQRYHTKTAKIDYLITGKGFCLHSGSNLVGVSGTARNGDKKGYYACYKKYNLKSCNKRNEKKDGVYIDENGKTKLGLEDDVVRMTYDYVLKNVEVIGEKLEQFRKKNITEHKIKDYEKRLADVERELEKCFSMLMEENEDMQRIARQKANDLSIKKKDLQTEINDLKLANKLSHSKEDFIAIIKAYLDGNPQDPEFKKRVINTFVNSVWVSDKFTICFYNLVGKQPLTLEEVKDILADYGISIDSNGELTIDKEKTANHEDLAVLTREVLVAGAGFEPTTFGL